MRSICFTVTPGRITYGRLSRSLSGQLTPGKYRLDPTQKTIFPTGLLVARLPRRQLIVSLLGLYPPEVDMVDNRVRIIRPQGRK